jgi:hypothetical protein
MQRFASETPWNDEFFHASSILNSGVTRRAASPNVILTTSILGSSGVSAVCRLSETYQGNGRLVPATGGMAGGGVHAVELRGTSEFPLLSLPFLVICKPA